MEIETKVLEVNSHEIIEKMKELGAQKILQARLTVDWYFPAGTKIGEDPWYLRIRSYDPGKTEITWKSLPQFVGNTRQSHEINFEVSDSQKAKDFLEAIGMEMYAHQEKDRISWTLDKWRFDLDQYPGMPAYLEIEGGSEQHVAEAINLLKLQQHKSVSEGERLLITNEYQLDWYNMKFN